MLKPAITLSVIFSVILLGAAWLTWLPGKALGEDGTLTMRCWRCQQAFQIPAEERSGKCPKCGALCIRPAATPVPTPSVQPTITPVPGSEPPSIPWQDGPKYQGSKKSVKGAIIGTHLSAGSGNLYLNFHPDYEKNLSIKIAKEDLGKFPADAANFYNGKTVVATGLITKEKKYLRLMVTDPADLLVIEGAPPAKPVPTALSSSSKKTSSSGGKKKSTRKKKSSSSSSSD